METPDGDKIPLENVAPAAIQSKSKSDGEFSVSLIHPLKKLKLKRIMKLTGYPAFCLALSLSPMAFAQAEVATSSTAGIILPLWADETMPGHGAPKPESDNHPKPGGVLLITGVSEPTLAVFKASDADGPAPAAIICPGGGYGALAYNREGTEIAAWLNSLRITGIVLKYRVPGNRDGAFQDAQRAVRLVRLHAAEWGIQPDKIGVIGFSAGGHLTARLSTNFEKPAYPELDPADKLNCRPDFAILVYPAFLEVNGALAPEMTVTPAMPKTLIVHSEDDLRYVPGSKLYDAALTAAEVPHQFLLYPTGGHGYGLHCYKDAKLWPVQTAEWLRKIGVL